MISSLSLHSLLSKLISANLIKSYLVESCRPIPPAILLLWVLTLRRVMFFGRLESTGTLLWLRRGESTLAALSSNSLVLWPFAAFSSSSSSIVPGSWKSFGDPSILFFHFLRKTIALISTPFRQHTLFFYLFSSLLYPLLTFHADYSISSLLITFLIVIC